MWFYSVVIIWNSLSLKMPCLERVCIGWVLIGTGGMGKGGGEGAETEPQE